MENACQTLSHLDSDNDGITDFERESTEQWTSKLKIVDWKLQNTGWMVILNSADKQYWS